MAVAGDSLLRRAVEEGGGSGDEVVAAAERLEKIGRGGGWRRGRTLRYGIAWVLYLVLLAIGSRYWVGVRPEMDGIAALGRLAGSGTGPPKAAKALEPEWKRKLTEDQELLLFGDLRQESKAERWRALWERDRSKPEFFVEYAAAYIAEREELPTDFLKIGYEIDPGNAWYSLVAAGVEAGKAGAAIPRSEEEKKAKEPAKYELRDSDRLQAAMIYLRNAAGMPRFDTRQRELMAERIRLLPQDIDWPGSMQRVSYTAGTTSRSLPARKIVGAIALECQRIEASRDPEAMKALIRDWDTLVELLAQSSDFNMVDALVKNAIVFAGYAQVARSARSMGLEEAERLEAIIRRLKEHRADLKAAKGTHEDFKQRAGVIAGLALPMVREQVLNPPEITEEKLKPARIAEHEFLAKIMTGAWSASFGILALVVWLYRFRGGELRRLLAERLGGLVDWKDQVWIMGAGVIAPLIMCLLMVRMPWTGAREWSIIAINFLPLCALLALGMWLMILLPVLIARWRLAKRAGFAGVGWARVWIPWVLAGCLITATPLMGRLLLPWNLKPPVVYGLLALSWVAQGWMLVVACRGIFSKQKHLLKRVILSRAVFPAYLLAGILAGTAALVSHQLEKRAIREDLLTGISAEKPSMNIYEYEVTQVMGRELRELIETGN